MSTSADEGSLMGPANPSGQTSQKIGLLVSYSR